MILLSKEILGKWIEPNGNNNNFMKFLGTNNFSTKIFVLASLGSVFLLYLFFQFSFLYLDNFQFFSWEQNQDNFSVSAFDKTEKEKTESDYRNYYDYTRETNGKNKDMFITRNPELGEKVTSPVLDSSDPSRGDKDSQVTIVVYSDFACSFCAEQEEMIRELIKKEYLGKVRLIRKDFPENDKESFSWRAARAARCAEQQGKYWEYHNLLSQAEKEFGKERFINLARQTGANKEEFQNCYEKKEVDNLIMKNIKEANDLGLPGVPYFYINEQEILGKLSETELKRIIKMELD